VRWCFWQRVVNWDAHFAGSTRYKVLDEVGTGADKATVWPLNYEREGHILHHRLADREHGCAAPQRVAASAIREAYAVAARIRGYHRWIGLTPPPGMECVAGGWAGQVIFHDEL
jgi:hypothetical protein